MESHDIVSKMNYFLHEAASALSGWLGQRLPRVSDTWWDDCVMDSLSYAQRDIAVKKNYTKLSDFDLAALLRITNKSWYDMRTMFYLPAGERDCVREMIGVRNNWAHCGAELPDKDSILHDLRTVEQFYGQLGCKGDIFNDISAVIEYVESPGSIDRNSANGDHDTEENSSFDQTDSKNQNQEGNSDAGNAGNGYSSQKKRNDNVDKKTESQRETSYGGYSEISPGELVYLISSPDTIGLVRTVTRLGTTTRYTVFVNNRTQTFYDGQIAPFVESTAYDWIDIETFRSRLTAYQINNPSSQNLYSLNSARIDFVPYQFRPALKMIHADEPRILIADSVGVGKTIEAGLIIKELEARKKNPEDLEKVMIICPKPLVAERKWELEMKRFDEDFVSVDGTQFRKIIQDTKMFGEWPNRYNRTIVPYSIMDKRAYEGDEDGRFRQFGLSELDENLHFDLVIVDEAHHIRNGSMEKSRAFAYKCTKFFCDHADAVVMLTATPLQMGDKDLFTLLNLLRPDVILDQKTFEMMSRPNKYISDAVHAIRTAREDWQSVARECLKNVCKTHWGDNVIAYNPAYSRALSALDRTEMDRTDRVKLISDVESLHSFHTMLNRTRRRDIQDFCIRHTYTVSTEFTASQRQLHDELLEFEERALSILHNSKNVSFLMSTIKRQAASCIFGLAPYIRDIINRRFCQLNDDVDLDIDGVDNDDVSAGKLEELARDVLNLADQLPEEDPKLEAALEFIRQKQVMENNKIMLFSSFRHTLAYLRPKLGAQGLRVEQIDGSVKDDRRYQLKERFELPKEDPEAIDLLLFTEVGSEGLDYQFCDTMINYDLPWNPMRIEQRIGRIDRRGQQSEAVNIYNMITEGTVDATIYHRCLERIGVFQQSIGECEEILGEISAEIERIAVDSKLTDGEREEKLEQIADNEVRKIEEMNRLEEEEKELFGFDLSEFTTSQEIKKAENPWLSPQQLQRLILLYFKTRIKTGASILGEGSLKTLRVSATARGKLKEDEQRLSDGTSAVKREWESYLNGRNPNHSITFDSETAKNHRESFLITSMHPLARQAARFFDEYQPSCLKLVQYTDQLPEGTWLFSVYAWKYYGIGDRFRMVTVCDQPVISENLVDILDEAHSVENTEEDNRLEWTSLENEQADLLAEAVREHKAEVNSTINYRLESLTNNHRNRVRMLDRLIDETFDPKIKRMKMSELETEQENYESKSQELKEKAEQADIHSELLANGIITVRRP